jgi:GTPase SAR1 family protein
MGCGGSRDAKTIEVNRELQSDKRTETGVRKLLFLGSGGSGKSTLFKQLRTIHGGGFTELDRRGYRDHIYSQVIVQMQDMLYALDELKEEDSDEYGPLELSEEGQEMAEYIDHQTGDAEVTKELAECITVLWNEKALKTVFKMRGTLKIDDSSAFFWDKVHDIVGETYLPSDDDILMVRHRTTGVVEQEFEVKGVTFRVVDVGGQKNERKKWINCFESVTAVIFVAAMSCYSEMLFEDETVNSMDDSLDLFREICNLRWFEKTAMILFLNKKDLFAERIQEIPLTFWDKAYKGDTTDYEECCGFIKTKFEALNENPKTKHIYTHYTMATDTKNVERVFVDVQHIAINNALAHAGVV